MPAEDFAKLQWGTVTEAGDVVWSRFSVQDVIDLKDGARCFEYEQERHRQREALASIVEERAFWTVHR